MFWPQREECSHLLLGGRILRVVHKHELLAEAIFFAWCTSARGPETKEYGCLGSRRLLGAPLGAQGPRHGGPGPPTHPGVPVSTDEARWPLRTTICMAKEMRFLRLLLEWPGFPTLSYSVIQCTAAVPLHGKCFFTGISFWENKILLLCSLLSSPPAPN